MSNRDRHRPQVFEAALPRPHNCETSSLFNAPQVRDLGEVGALFSVPERTRRLEEPISMFDSPHELHEAEADPLIDWTVPREASELSGRTRSHCVTTDDEPTHNSAPSASMLVSPMAVAWRNASGRCVGIGETVGSYRIEEELGTGGMGTVYAARHEVLDRRVAIKFLLPALARNVEIAGRFFREAKAAAAVEHSGIVRVFDVGMHNGAAYIVMEYLRGMSLSRRLQSCGRLPLADALCIAAQTADALAPVHARGIVHRDLKPGNIFLVESAQYRSSVRVVIIDFGVAKLTIADGPGMFETRADTVLGTPSYMAPEQGMGAGLVDHRADVYALGCLLYHMLCGRPPFVARTAFEIMLAHRQLTACPVSNHARDAPAALDTVMRSALAKCPGDRYPSMSVFADRLRAVAVRLGDAAIPTDDDVGEFNWSEDDYDVELVFGPAEPLATQHDEPSQSVPARRASSARIARGLVVGATAATLIGAGLLCWFL